jgi:hypothetical protein
MKSFVSCVLLFAALHQQLTDTLKPSPLASDIDRVGNIFIITIDGFRWQELFGGADPALINCEKYTPDTATMKLMYWSPDPEGRRKKLLPFFWNVIGSKGQLFGNREYQNKVNTSNAWSISYPGYNEILTGNTDISIYSNEKYTNPHANILGYLATKAQFKGKVAAFTSWDVFPYILNEASCGIQINSGYENVDEQKANTAKGFINQLQHKLEGDNISTRHDELTFIAAEEYIEEHHPKVLYLGLGETDEAAHNERYDLYLEKANEADRIIAKLWHLVQTTPGYKDNTTFVITTDHGRGKKKNNWSEHGAFIKGSSQTWLAVLGPNIAPIGEIKQDQQIYQKQLAQTIAALLGEKFVSTQSIAPAVSFR